jgi:3-dehydroquinate dehydratase type I
MICISIPEKNSEACLALIKTADMAEIRIDMAEFDESTVRSVFSKAGKPLIATCRPELVENTKRIALLKAAIEAGATYIDIEIEASNEIKQELIQHAKSYDCKIIISYHNYENTPNTNELHAIIDSCFEAGADIAKIATTAQNSSDSARILGLYAQYTSLVALAMGEAGKITRVANTFLGSPFTFAAISEKQKTAPGQLTVAELKVFQKL